MNLITKFLHIAQWTAIILMFAFPLVMVWPFVDLTWWQALLPVGLIPIGAVIVIPLALLFKADMRTFPLYGNKEEGYPDWFDRYVQKFWYKKIFPKWWWYSIRNPLNNMRFLFDDSKEFTIVGWQPQSMEAHDLIVAGVTSASRWSYRGALAGYRRIWLNDDDTYSEIWIGWKVGSIVPGLGFATQVRLKRKIGT